MTALDVLGALQLDTGDTWGHLAHAFQVADVEAFVDPSGPRWHWWLRARGMSKTSDAAGLLLALLVDEAPPLSRSYAFAVDQKQAGLLLDSLASFVQRTPELRGAVEVGARRVMVVASGATLEVEASDAASAFGLRPWLVFADELAAWPATSNHRRLWSAIVSALPKVPGSRLIVATSAGSPSHWSFERWSDAQGSPHWRVSNVAGPSPWWSEADVEAVRSDLTEAEFRRLVLNEWAEADDALSTAADVRACVTHGSSLEPRSGVRYAMSLDVGTRRDATAVAVGHLQSLEDGGRRVVIDRVLRWQGSRAKQVDLEEVEGAIVDLWRRYNHPPLVFDRHQAEGSTQRLRRAGVHTVEFVFSSSGVNRLARALYGALRDRMVGLPDDEALLDELTSVRLVEGGPGLLKMVNPPGSHDDMAVAVAMLIQHLSENGPRNRPKLTVRGANPQAESVPRPRRGGMKVRGRQEPGQPFGPVTTTVTRG